PPSAAGRRGVPLPGDGGLPDRSDHRSGAWSAIYSLPSRALHLDRRDHAFGSDHPAVAGAFRHPVASGVLRAGGARYHRQSGGPVGVETIAAALGDERDVVEEVIEPYLLQEGFVQRTPRGRVLTRNAFRHLDLPMPATMPAQLDLLTPVPWETENPC